MTSRSRVLRGLAAALLGAALAVTAAGCTSADSTGQHATAQSLDVAAFGERAATEGVVILDVRTPEEYAGGHLPGAINIDVESPDFAARLADLDPAAPYAIYCHSGNRSKVAMDTMAAAGFTDLADLKGGIAAWADAGGAIVS